MTVVVTVALLKKTSQFEMVRRDVGRSFLTSWYSALHDVAGRRLALATLADGVRSAGFRVTRTELLSGVLPIGFAGARP